MTSGAKEQASERHGRPEEGAAAAEAGARRVRPWLIGIVALGLTLLLLWVAGGFFLLAFAAILMGLLLSGTAGWLEERTALGYRTALLGVTFALLGGMGTLVWIAGPALWEQLSQLAEQLPAAIGKLQEQAEGTPWAGLVGDGRSAEGLLDASGWQVLGRVTGIFSTALNGVANALLILVVSFYLAVQRGLYHDGALRLVPPARRGKAHEVMAALAHALRRWILGRLLSMAAVAVLSMAALAILGLPYPIALGFMAGLLSIVPYLGPLAATVVGVVVGWAEGGVTTALWIAGTFFGVQLLEGNAITPLIQWREVSLPPAMLIGSQVLFGLLSGVVGVLLAAPILVAAIVLVQILYVNELLGDEVQPLGSRE